MKVHRDTKRGLLRALRADIRLGGGEGDDQDYEAACEQLARELEQRPGSTGWARAALNAAGPPLHRLAKATC
jgi:hypothetical protein